MKIAIHIGYHKTGTTAIQHLLHANRQILRERDGIAYPETGLHKIAHGPLAWSLHPERKRQVGAPQDAAALFAAMLAELRQRGVDRAVVSSESFSAIARGRVARLAGLLEGHDVTIIAYVRRQDRYIESLYNQQVKFEPTRLAEEFGVFVERQMRRDALDYHLYFRAWAAAFGRENLKLRLYERGRFRGGDVRRDFCDILGVRDEGLVFQESDSNESLDFDSVCFLSRLNRVPLTRDQHGQVLRALREYARTSGARPRGFFTARERDRILRACAEGNRRFARDFFGDEGAFEPAPGEVAGEEAAEGAYTENKFYDMLAHVLPAMLREAKGGAPAVAHRRRPA